MTAKELFCTYLESIFFIYAVGIFGSLVAQFYTQGGITLQGFLMGVVASVIALYLIIQKSRNHRYMISEGRVLCNGDWVVDGRFIPMNDPGGFSTFATLPLPILTVYTYITADDLTWPLISLGVNMLFVVFAYYAARDKVKSRIKEVADGKRLSSGHARRQHEDGSFEVEVGIIDSDKTVWKPETPDRVLALLDYKRSLIGQQKHPANLPQPDLAKA